MFDGDLGCHSCGALLDGNVVRCNSCGACLLEHTHEPRLFFESYARTFPNCRMAERDRSLLIDYLETHAYCDDEFISQLARAKLSGLAGTVASEGERGIVTLGSRVLFRFEGGGSRCRTLAHWDHNSIPGRSISVMTPLGLALLGMQEGNWAPVLRRLGTVQLITVERVMANGRRRSHSTAAGDGDRTAQRRRDRLPPGSGKSQIDLQTDHYKA